MLRGALLPGLWEWEGSVTRQTSLVALGITAAWLERFS
jgi:hypothetical protein